MKKLVLVCCALVLALPAFAAVSVVQHNSNHSYADGSTVSCALSSTGASRNIIVGAVSVDPVSAVADDRGNVYTAASGSHAINTAGLETEVWHSLGTVSGVTNITVTFGGSKGLKVCFAYEIAGPLTFDSAAKIDNGIPLADGDPYRFKTCAGAAVTTSTAAGFVLAVVNVDPVAENPKNGTEFTSGGELADENNASVSLVSSGLGSHQPVWRIDTHSTAAAPGPAVTFVSSSASYKQ